jgi:hypothetical protein
MHRTLPVRHRNRRATCLTVLLACNTYARCVDDNKAEVHPSGPPPPYFPPTAGVQYSTPPIGFIQQGPPGTATHTNVHNTHRCIRTAARYYRTSTARAHSQLPLPRVQHAVSCECTTLAQCACRLTVQLLLKYRCPLRHVLHLSYVRDARERKHAPIVAPMRAHTDKHAPTAFVQWQQCT